MGKTVEFKVVGLTFIEGYPDNLHRLRDIDEDRQRRALMHVSPADEFGIDSIGLPAEKIPVVLIRNPENEYDENAIEVHLPALGKNGMIGHVPRTLAAKLAPSIDRGDKWDAVLTTVLIDPEHEDKPGALVTIECVSRVAPAGAA